MKHIKSFNENLNLPKYTKGEIILFLKDDHIGMDVDSCAKELGYKVSDETPEYSGNNSVIIKCKPGEEDTCGNDFIDNYPEFFMSFERRDLRYEHMYKNYELLNNEVASLDEFLGRKFINSEWNERLDDIIKIIQDMKS
jgi:hypothetical protein